MGEWMIREIYYVAGVRQVGQWYGEFASEAEAHEYAARKGIEVEVVYMH